MMENSMLRSDAKAFNFWLEQYFSIFFRMFIAAKRTIISIC